MDLEKLLHDHRIPVAPPGEKNYREGWANIRCPFCADNSFHLGINLQGRYAHCWRCGSHFLDKVVAKLLGITVGKARGLLKEYGGRPGRKVKEVKRKIRTKSHRLPSDTGKMKNRHRKYLQSRGFDPEKLEKEWGLLGTGPVSTLDKISYKHRVLAPIHWNGERVSFQARDITGRHKLKYLACPEERELIKHKHILYGRQEKWKETGICVEGITDVWRLGFAAFCTFGIDYTQHQVRQITKHFSRVIIIFDEEPQAQRQARKLQADLEIRGLEVIRVNDLKTDPGNLSDKQAEELIKRIY